MLDPDLLAILRCPKCRGGLTLREGALVCASCRLLYTVEDGIPNLLLDEARPLAAESGVS
jgi:hypothetical protein